MQVEWNLCSEGLPSIGHPVCWIANYEQNWGLATLCDGTDCHSEDYWWLEANQESLAQMFVTHWAEVSWPDLPVGVPLLDREGREVKEWPEPPAGE